MSIERSFDSILRQFSPLERKSLLSWLEKSDFESHQNHSPYHLKLVKNTPWVTRPEPDRKTKIGFMALHDFGNRLSENTLALLVDQVNQRIERLA